MSTVAEFKLKHVLAAICNPIDKQDWQKGEHKKIKDVKHLKNSICILWAWFQKKYPVYQLYFCKDHDNWIKDIN